MVIGFDWDGTLVRSFTADPLPGAPAALAALPAGARTFIAAQMGGLAYRVLLGQTHYPSAAEMVALITNGLAALGWRPDLLVICVHPGNPGQDWQTAAEAVVPDLREGLLGRVPEVGEQVFVTADPAWRKPAPTMLQHAAAQLQADPATMVYVGDAPTDQAAAQAIGARFIWATEFVQGTGF